MKQDPTAFEKRIEIFDNQIEREFDFSFIKERKQCPSYWGKKIFIESQHLSIFDWRSIRDESYWHSKDSMSKKLLKEKDFAKKILMEAKMNQYTYTCIINYKNKIK